MPFSSCTTPRQFMTQMSRACNELDEARVKILEEKAGEAYALLVVGRPCERLRQLLAEMDQVCLTA